MAVEAQPGHDIGVITLTGKLVLLQMQKANLKPGTEIRRVYRKARQTDLEKFEEAKSREHQTMIRSRQIAKELELQMKIGDVEYQGDGNKAISITLPMHVSTSESSSRCWPTLSTYASK